MLTSKNKLIICFLMMCVKLIRANIFVSLTSNPVPCDLTHDLANDLQEWLSTGMLSVF